MVKHMFPRVAAPLLLLALGFALLLRLPVSAADPPDCPTLLHLQQAGTLAGGSFVEQQMPKSDTYVLACHYVRRPSGGSAWAATRADAQGLLWRGQARYVRSDKNNRIEMIAGLGDEALYYSGSSSASGFPTTARGLMVKSRGHLYEAELRLDRAADEAATKAWLRATIQSVMAATP